MGWCERCARSCAVAESTLAVLCARRWHARTAACGERVAGARGLFPTSHLSQAALVHIAFTHPLSSFLLRLGAPSPSFASGARVFPRGRRADAWPTVAGAAVARRAAPSVPPPRACAGPTALSSAAAPAAVAAAVAAAAVSVEEEAAASKFPHRWPRRRPRRWHRWQRPQWRPQWRPGRPPRSPTPCLRACWVGSHRCKR